MSLRAYFAKQSPLNSEVLNQIKLLFKTTRLPRRLGLATASKSIQPTVVGAPLNDIFLFVLSSFLVSSCAPATPPAAAQVVTVYSTSAAQPWLPPLYDCAGSASVISRVDDSSAADIVLRVGEPGILVSSAYQIDTEEILIVTHRQSPVQNMTLEEARALFAGQGDVSVQVWVYTSEEDVQGVFDQFVMEGRSVTASARLAVNPQQMSDTLVNEPNTVGILPRHWKVGDVRAVYAVASVPVLALTKSEPQGTVKELIACLQK